MVLYSTENKGDMERKGGKEKRCIFPEREQLWDNRKARELWGDLDPRYQNMEPSGRSLWSAREKEKLDEACII